MRVIKFRAWNKKQKYMQDFDGHKCGILYSCGSFDVSSGYNSFDEPTFESDTSEDWEVMQFTGLQDKNGVDIYEGDLISIRYKIKSVYLNEKPSPVFFDEDEACFEVTLPSEKRPMYLHEVAHGSSVTSSSHTCKVIGNIHENPELLEGVK